MKRILSVLTIALLGAAAPLFAEPLFNDPVFDGFTPNYIDPFTNQYWQGDGNGSYYTIRFSGSGTFYLTNVRNNPYSADENFTNPLYGITQYGYIDSKNVTHTFDLYNEDGSPSENIVEFTSVVDNGSAFDGRVVTREGYYLGKFNAGDEIQIYLAGNVGGNDVWTATNSPQTGVYSSRFGGRQDLLNPTLSIGQLYFGEQDSSQMNFGIVASASSYVPGSSDTFGAPLPGGLQIALIAGIFGLGFWYVRRRKSVAV